MTPELKSLPGFKVVGIEIRTSNAAETNAASAKIPGLWGRFYQEKIPTTIAQAKTDDQRRCHKQHNPFRPQQKLFHYNKLLLGGNSVAIIFSFFNPSKVNFKSSSTLLFLVQQRCGCTFALMEP